MVQHLAEDEHERKADEAEGGHDEDIDNDTKCHQYTNAIL